MASVEFSRSNWGLGLGFLASAAIAAAAVAFQSKATSARIDELGKELSRVKKRDSEPRVVIRDLRSEPAAVTPTEREGPGEAKPEASAESDPAEMTPEESEHRLMVINQARLEACEKAHTAEAPDPEWAKRAARTILDTYGSEEFKGVQVSVDCRATLCRASFTYTDLNGVRALMATNPWSCTRFTYVDQEKHQGTSYFSREEFELPSVDPQALAY